MVFFSCVCVRETDKQTEGERWGRTGEGERKRVRHRGVRYIYIYIQ